MRVFIAVLVLIFSLQSWTKADDIKDFQIDGMSIGDSALQYFDKETIISSIKETSYFDDGFYDVSLESNDDKYEYYTLTFKKNDNNEKNVTKDKYIDRINNIKNDKIKKSLLELTKIYKQR